MISKWVPTTKYCSQCGKLNALGLDERVYRCSCGYEQDRDIHSAKNMILFGSTHRAECLEQASAESPASTYSGSETSQDMQADSMKRKQEATIIQGGA